MWGVLLWLGGRGMKADKQHDFINASKQPSLLPSLGVMKKKKNLFVRDGWSSVVWSRSHVA